MAKKISLDKFAKGALADAFHFELARVMTNIIDLNTKATAPRSITLTIDFKANEARDFGDAIVTGKSKLAPRNSAKTTIAIGYDRETSQGECQEINGEILGQMDIAEVEAQWAAEQAEREAQASANVVNFNNK